MPQKRYTPQKSYEDAKVSSLYQCLDPLSISTQLAFYELYPNTHEGNTALRNIWRLLGCEQRSDLAAIPFHHFSSLASSALIFLVNRSSFTPPILLSEEELQKIEIIANYLPNRKLKGHFVNTEEEVLQLPTEEVDINRGLLISQFENHPDKAMMVRQYEAILDLMALQILARLYKDGGIHAPDKRKIEETNDFIFNELHFRYPPHSSYASEIDQYTFLTSVLDSRRGVCLGVSILYLAIAQRIGLPLEIVTPPGHIFVRYCKNNSTINIETTARGASLPDETYLGVNTNSLQRRTIKETIGFAYFNQASVFSQQLDYEKAVSTYKKALLYMPNDPLTTELLGFHLLFTGNIEEGRNCLEQIRGRAMPGTLYPDSMAADYLDGKVDVEGLKPIFLHVDETQESLLKKQNQLQDVIKKFPEFRSGLLQLATTWLQLERAAEGSCILESYVQIDPNDPTVSYYLAALNAERYNYNKAWYYLKCAEEFTAKHDHHPQALIELRKSLQLLAPE